MMTEISFQLSLWVWTWCGDRAVHGATLAWAWLPPWSPLKAAIICQLQLTLVSDAEDSDPQWADVAAPASSPMWALWWVWAVNFCQTELWVWKTKGPRRPSTHFILSSTTLCNFCFISDSCSTALCCCKQAILAQIGGFLWVSGMV